MISPLAFVDPAAKLGNNVTVHPFAYIDKDVEIGDDCVVMPNASIMEGARLGKNVKVYNGAIVSADPQDFRWKGERSFCLIGDNVVIREMAIVNRSIHEGGSTKIGSNSFIMAESHVGHDTEVCDNCVLGNNVLISGDVRIESCTVLSTGVKVYEKSRIGTHPNAAPEPRGTKQNRTAVHGFADRCLTTRPWYHDFVKGMQR